MGELLEVGPFNSFGRRQVRIRGIDGSPTILMQGITELTGRYASVEVLRYDRALKLDMRIATDTLSSDTLNRLFRQRIDQRDVDDRLTVVRFFIETERYADAHRELERILADFPNEDFLKPQLAAMVARQAGQLLDEAERRRDSGQPELAQAILQRFPVALVDAKTKLRVGDALQRLQQDRELCDKVVGDLERLSADSRQVDSPVLKGFIQELRMNLTPATLPRLNDFLRLGEVDDIPIDNRISLAINGWIQGPGAGGQNLTLALESVGLRDSVLAYLQASNPLQRSETLQAIVANEASRPETIAAILKQIPPPLAELGSPDSQAGGGNSLIPDPGGRGNVRLAGRRLFGAAAAGVRPAEELPVCCCSVGRRCLAGGPN